MRRQKVITPFLNTVPGKVTSDTGYCPRHSETEFRNKIFTLLATMVTAYQIFKPFGSDKMIPPLGETGRVRRAQRMIIPNEGTNKISAARSRRHEPCDAKREQQRSFQGRFTSVSCGKQIRPYIITQHNVQRGKIHEGIAILALHGL